jgi:hypothetical protein
MQLARISSLLAQATGPSPSVCWAIVLFCVILGLMVALRPSRRSVDFRRPKDQ